MRRLILAVTLIALGITACATGGTGTRSSSSRSVITAEDLAEHPGISAFEALQQLRPQWLRATRGTNAPRVVVDRMPVEQNYLRTIRASDVLDMRLLSMGDASMRYGTGYPAGAIEVRMKRD